MNVKQIIETYQACTDMGLIMWNYYTELKAAGFDEDQAMGLLYEYQRRVFSGGVE